MHTFQVHPFEPLWDEHSQILILGSFPSVRSREIGFYYGHPQNHFWKLMSILYQDDMPYSVAERKSFALKHGFALWDAIKSCTITGSSDSSIREAVPNDIAFLLRNSSIQRVFCNGCEAFKLYERYCAPECGMRVTLLPSTRAANAAWSIEKLAESWKIILP